MVRIGASSRDCSVKMRVGRCAGTDVGVAWRSRPGTVACSESLRDPLHFVPWNPPGGVGDGRRVSRGEGQSVRLLSPPTFLTIPIPLQSRVSATFADVMWVLP